MDKKRKLDEEQNNQATREKANAGESEKEPKREILQDEIRIKPFYTPLDLAEKGFNYEKDLGVPGQYPYTRGSGTMYPGLRKDFAHYVGRGSPEDSNKLWKTLLARGMTRIMVATDLPTQLGYDPDHLMATGEVGKVGVSLASLRDWEVAFEGIDLNRVDIRTTNTALGGITIAMHCVTAEKQGVSREKLRGENLGDILNEYVVRGNYIFPLEPAMRLLFDTVSYCSEYAPNYWPLTIVTTQASETGLPPAESLAYGLAKACAYIQAAKEREIDVDIIAPRMCLLIDISHHGFLLQIAKVRAFRKVWAKIMKERFNAKKPESMAPKLHLVEVGSSLVKEQYLNNISRATIALLASGLAGGDGADARCFDEYWGTPSEEALVTAIRCMQIVAFETGITDTTDPLAGSYFIESLTREFEDLILKELEVIDKLGGALEAFKQGYLESKFKQASNKRHKALSTGEVIRIGENCFRSDEGEIGPPTVYRADPRIGEKRAHDMRELRHNRDNEKVKKCLKEIKEAANGSNNLMPPIIEAVKAYATQGEMCDALKEVWGEYARPLIKF